MFLQTYYNKPAFCLFGQSNVLLQFYLTLLYFIRISSNKSDTKNYLKCLIYDTYNFKLDYKEREGQGYEKIPLLAACL